MPAQVRCIKQVEKKGLSRLVRAVNTEEVGDKK